VLYQLDPKHPTSIERFWWDVATHCARSGTTIAELPTITEVDECGVEVAVPTVTITGITYTAGGVVSALVGGGVAGKTVYLRCRYVLANGETDYITIKVRIAHQ
jgi:hypothetical protein